MRVVRTPVAMDRGHRPASCGAGSAFLADLLRWRVRLASLFVNYGGPGVARYRSSRRPGQLDKLGRGRFDVVGWDPRGTGASAHVRCLPTPAARRGSGGATGRPRPAWPIVNADRYTGPWNASTPNPILVIGTRHDPQTAYAKARRVARRFGNAVLLTLNGYAHTSDVDPSPASIRRSPPIWSGSPPFREEPYASPIDSRLTRPSARHPLASPFRDAERRH